MQPNQNPLDRQTTEGINSFGSASSTPQSQFVPQNSQASAQMNVNGVQNTPQPDLFPQYQPPVQAQTSFGNTTQQPMAASQMKKGRSSIGTLLAIILLSLSLMGAIGFGVWSFGERQDYKNNSDEKSKVASELAVKAESERKDTEFVELEKLPLKTYTGPDSYGSIKVSYPKTWSAYILETNQGTLPFDGYLHPNVVPDVKGGTAFALRIQVVNTSYEQEMKTLDSKVKSGKVKVAPYLVPKVPGVSGSRVTGEVNTGQNDTMVVVPLRDKTLKIYTESPEFLKDFDSIIMANMTFVP